MTHTKRGFWAAAVGAVLVAASAMTAVAAEAPQSLTGRETSSASSNSALKALIAPAPATGTMVLAQKGKKGGGVGGGGGGPVVVKKKSNKGVGIAAGIAAVTAAAILLSAKPSHAEGHRYRDGNRGASKWQCRKWDDRCDDGEKWACRRLRNEC